MFVGWNFCPYWAYMGTLVRALLCFKDLNRGDDNVENEIDLNLNAETNELINSRIEGDEIETAIKKLKNNKAGDEDAVKNEYIKHSSNKIIELFIQLFNIIFDGGKIRDIWLTGNIIPIKTKIKVQYV